MYIMIICMNSKTPSWSILCVHNLLLINFGGVLFIKIGILCSFCKCMCCSVYVEIITATSCMTANAVIQLVATVTAGIADIQLFFCS